MAKALAALILLSNGIPMLFMGQEVGETVAFSFDNKDEWLTPQFNDLPPGHCHRQDPYTRLVPAIDGLAQRSLQNDSADIGKNERRKSQRIHHAA
jgi:1,4-alpha-glucan branching enzyme